MKTYKTWEAIKMLEENPGLEFENECSDALKYENARIEFYTDGEKTHWYGMYLNHKWKLIQNPVTFDEVLKSNKRCRVEHEMLKNMYIRNFETDDNSSDKINEIAREVKNENYIRINELLTVIGWKFGTDDCKDIIANGKWYLE